MTKPTEPACGNNPSHQWSDGDRKAVAEFRAYLADRAALRDRIAAALLARIKRATVSKSQPHDGITSLLAANEYDLADAVLAVLPPPTDQADRGVVLAEAADWLKAWRPEFFERWAITEQERYEGGVDDAAAELRRLADEAQQPETAERPRCPHCQLPHNLTPGSLPVAACVSTRQRIAEAEQRHEAGDHGLCCRADCEHRRTQRGGGL